MTSSFRPASWTPGITKEVYHVERIYEPRDQSFCSPASAPSEPRQTAKACEDAGAPLLEWQS
jgi:hypothetical protein